MHDIIKWQNELTTFFEQRSHTFHHREFPFFDPLILNNTGLSHEHLSIMWRIRLTTNSTVCLYFLNWFTAVLIYP